MENYLFAHLTELEVLKYLPKFSKLVRPTPQIVLFCFHETNSEKRIKISFTGENIGQVLIVEKLVPVLI